MKPRIIFLIGPPGSGKTTQSIYLEQDLNFHHIESSQLIRDVFSDEEKIKNDSTIIEEKKKYDSGELVSSEWVSGLIKEKLVDLSEKNTDAVFGGFPRNIEEVVDLVQFMEANFSKGVFKIIHLDIDKDESLKRNSIRKVCVDRGHPIPPEFIESEKCPWDGSAFTKRDMDSPEIIIERFKVYLEETEPVLEFLKENKPEYIEVLDGENPISEIHKQIISIIEKND